MDILNISLIILSLFVPLSLTKDNEQMGYVYLVPSNQLNYPPSGTLSAKKMQQYPDDALLNALLFSTTLGLSPGKIRMGVNHSNQVPINPYIALLLSQYGRYIPSSSHQNFPIHYYAAANNYHNNKPFGSYKVDEEAK